MAQLSSTKIYGDLFVNNEIKSNKINVGSLNVTSGLSLNNTNITGVNHIVIEDSGTNEGIEWKGGSGWKIYESPDTPANASGNLQFVTGSTRRVTIETNGRIQMNGGATYAAPLKSANGYWGMCLPDSTDENWTRTTLNGIIPYHSGGASSLGTSSWPFANIFSNNIYSGGTLIESKFVHQLRRTSAENLNNANYPNPYTASATDVTCSTHLGLPNAWHHFQYFRHEDNNGFGVQVAYPLNNWNESIRFRSSNGITWSGWKKILCTSKDQNVNGMWFEGTSAPTGTNRLNYSGYLYATRIYNAVYNDYAEYFERYDLNESLEPGDIIISKKGKFTKSTKANQRNVIGVYSDSYGHILGGKGDGHDDENFIPIGLSGRVDVKVIGKAEEGDLIVSSDIPGVGIVNNDAKLGTIIGKVIEDKNNEEIEKVKIIICLS